MQDFGNLKAVYQIKGEDAFVMQNTLNNIQNACENPLGDVNIAVFDDENFNADKIILSAEQLPLMAKKRLVLVKNIMKAKDSELKKLAEYCKNPAENSVVVFFEIVGFNVFGKLPAEKIVCKKLTASELQKIIKTELEPHKKTMQLDAINLLIQYCSSDLTRIKNEIYKLVFLNDNAEITTEDIKKCVHKNDEFSVFELASALTNGNVSLSINLMKKMLETMEFPVILSLVNSNFRKMFYIAISDGTNAELAQKLGAQEYSITATKSKMKNLKPMQIVKIMDTILEIDFSIKSGKMAVDNAMYFLVLSIVKIVKGENSDN